jgi:hypothetical protein
MPFRRVKFDGRWRAMLRSFELQGGGHACFVLRDTP